MDRKLISISLIKKSRMNWVLMSPFLIAAIISIIPSVSAGELDYFPGLRRPPVLQNWYKQREEEESRRILAQLSSIIEEQARRRLQQHFQLQQQQQNYRENTLPGSTNSVVSQDEFTYKFPEQQSNTLNGNIDFAVSPGDPRYYKPNAPPNGMEAIFKNIAEDYEEPTGNRDEENVIKSSSDGVPYLKLKAPMVVNPKFLIPQSRDVLTREEINDMIEKLKGQEEKMGPDTTIIKSDVVQKPMDIDSVMGMYVVALIAGISAAITVGLISIGIAWYTLHKKTKAAADVEYPAYGVTGPNKDMSPSSGDRRLAQSAQMYHYQHQKQQIIAMENRSHNGDRNASLTDVESDDENEEGDYTVYECPGLAPTGEMEVKNPLFLDDPTPATPANLVTKKTGKSSTTSTSAVQPTTGNENTPQPKEDKVNGKGSKKK